MGRNLVMLWLLLSVITSCCLVKAQIPKECATSQNLTSRICCPVPTDVTGATTACGNNLGRGVCRRVSSQCYTGYTNNGDPRRNWPSYFFDQICHCIGNYAGFDCGECRFGYEGNDCNTKSRLRERRNIMDMTNSEWGDYNSKIIRSKNAEESRYVILVDNKPVSISLYNMFVWMHHYVAKNNRDTYTKQESANDYAHESTGFLTWHRLFLLWFEREMQIFLNDPSFTIRYWNWTNPNDRTSIFSFNKLGSNGNDGTVSSNYYGGNNWQSVCWFRDSTKNSQTCNPTDSDGIRSIIRCPSPTQCAGTYSKWTSQQTINRALNLGSYSSGPYYNKYSENTFSNFLEGFEPNPSGDLQNLEFNYGDGIAIARHLHNLVHIILGIGNFSNGNLVESGTLSEGTMGNVAASPNDPVFINHHTMVDSIFEQWLQQNPNSVYGGPKNDPKFAGHSANDCIVPFIPVYTHMDMFKPAENFGYSYDYIKSPTTGPTTATTDSSKGIFVDGILILLTLMSSSIIILQFF